MKEEIEQRLKRLGYNADLDILDIPDLLLQRHHIYIGVIPGNIEGKFSYSVSDLDDNHAVDEELRSFPTYKEALENGILESLAYVKLYKDSGIVVAIDGYPACGKSTIAKRLAKEVGYTYIDSGAMYRAAALYFDRTGEKMNEDTVKNIHISFRKDENQNQHTILNGEDVESEIRTLRISELASKIGVVQCVRDYLGDLQREMGKIGGVVMDGRDIGTVVFPNAQLKLFLTADREVRASRRQKELGDAVSVEDVMKDLVERDWRDIDQFKGARKAESATVLNTTDLTEDEQYEFVKKLFEIALRNYRLKK